MPSRFPTLRIHPLRGLNLKDDSHNLKTGDLSVATNVLCNNDGSIQRCDGYEDLFTEISTDTDLLGSIFEWKRYDGSRDIVFVYNDSLCMVTSYFSNPSYEILTATVTPQKKMRYVHYNDYLYFGNGTDVNKVVTPSYIHKATTASDSTTVASDLASIITLYNALRTAYNTHLASTAAHLKADTTNDIETDALAGGASQGDANTACNALKTAYNAHLTQSTIHPMNDAYMAVIAADASSEATCITLINNIQKVFNQHVGSARVMSWCLTAPGAAPTAAAAAGGSLEDGDYLHCYTYYDKNNGVESAPSLISAATTTGTGNNTINLSAMEVSLDPFVTHKRIYRTFVDGGTFYRVAEIPNTQTTYSDTTADDALGAGIATEDMSVVPPTSIFEIFKDRIFLSGYPSEPYRVYYTEPTYPAMYKDAFNYQDFDVAIMGIAALQNGLLIFEKHKTWIWMSPPFGSPPVAISSVIGCSNAESIVKIDGDLVYRTADGRGAVIQNPVVWQSEHGVFASNGNPPVCVSEYINNSYVGCNLDSAVSVYDALNNRIYCIVRKEA